MNKKTSVIVSIIVGLAVLGGGVMAYTNSQNKAEEKERMAMEQKTEDQAMMKKEDVAMEADKMTKTDESMEKDAAMSKHGAYVTLADYNADPSKYADTQKVYFFHASWCPICQGIDKEITADSSTIPANVTLIKTDFDNSTELRQKYGVTYQYTFVQVDNSGNETAQWSATSLKKAIDGIKL